MSTERVCVRCGQPYAPGTYRIHRRVHSDRRVRRPRSYGSENPERDAAIVTALNDDPYLTLETVAMRYGITRERVRQIYVLRGGHQSARRRPLRRDQPKMCRACGDTYIGDLDAHCRIAGHGPGETQYLRNREWVHLYEDGLSSVQIGRIYGQAPSYVGSTLLRYGITKRPRKGSVVVRKRDVDGR